MTDFSDFKTEIAEWANRLDWSDTLVTSFVRMAEAKFNAELRVDRMIQFAQIISTARCACLPDDWLAMDLVQAPSRTSATGYAPIHYKARDEFFNLTDAQALGYYTIEGRVLTIGGTPAPDGTTYSIAYYGEVPVFSDTLDSWIYTKYPSLYLFAALMHADLHAVGEESQAANLKALVEEQIQKLNAGHLAAKASGSRVARTRARSFG
jgi:hypothetical protein